ncbi:MAG: NAD(P)H-dependent oxidoreductase [Bacteroidales bacterium]|nr:NAD(P)H-dependent oxidoreductase [Bacteroidales bacterium]
MANKILILFAHPRFERSASNLLMVRQLQDVPGITFHDLYEIYPDFNIDVEAEKALLEEHNIIIWHHPFYWYSAPPLLKQWIDLVLEFEWAYGPGGNALEGKTIFNCITVGGPRAAYSRDGYNRFTLLELLTPFNQTAYLCRMTWLPPFAMHGTHRISEDEKLQNADQYRLLLERLVKGEFSAEEILKYEYLNDWLDNIKTKITV